MKEYLNGFNLPDDQPAQKYKTQAADFYRQKLNAHANGNDFFEEAPSVDEGKKVMPDSHF